MNWVQDDKGDMLPEGVELYDPDDYNWRRQSMFDSVLDAVKGSFPRSHGGVTLSLDKLRYEGPEDIPPDKERRAMLRGSYPTRRLKGLMVLTDTETGEVLDSREETLMRVPIMTRRGTFIHSGNDYTTALQARLMPGVYPRRKDSGEVESQFNIKRGTGPAFRVSMDPETAVMRMSIRGSNVKLLPVLRNLGVSDDSIRKSWGDAIFERNAREADDTAWHTAYSKLTGKPWDDQADVGELREEARSVLHGMLVNEDVVRTTLPGLSAVEKSASDMGALFGDLILKLNGK